MKKEWLSTKWTFFTGAIFAFPAAYFVLSNYMNFSMAEQPTTKMPAGLQTQL